MQDPNSIAMMEWLSQNDDQSSVELDTDVLVTSLFAEKAEYSNALLFSALKSELQRQSTQPQALLTAIVAAFMAAPVEAYFANSRTLVEVLACMAEYIDTEKQSKSIVPELVELLMKDLNEHHAYLLRRTCQPKADRKAVLQTMGDMFAVACVKVLTQATDSTALEGLKIIPVQLISSKAHTVFVHWLDAVLKQVEASGKYKALSIALQPLRPTLLTLSMLIDELQDTIEVPYIKAIYTQCQKQGLLTPNGHVTEKARVNSQSFKAFHNALFSNQGSSITQQQLQAAAEPFFMFLKKLLAYSYGAIEEKQAQELPVEIDEAGYVKTGSIALYDQLCAYFSYKPELQDCFELIKQLQGTLKAFDELLITADHAQYACLRVASIIDQSGYISQDFQTAFIPFQNASNPATELLQSMTDLQVEQLEDIATLLQKQFKQLRAVAAQFHGQKSFDIKQPVDIDALRQVVPESVIQRTAAYDQSLNKAYIQELRYLSAGLEISMTDARIILANVKHRNRSFAGCLYEVPLDSLVRQCDCDAEHEHLEQQLKRITRSNMYIDLATRIMQTQQTEMSFDEIQELCEPHYFVQLRYILEASLNANKTTWLAPWVRSAKIVPWLMDNQLEETALYALLNQHLDAKHTASMASALAEIQPQTPRIFRLQLHVRVCSDAAAIRKSIESGDELQLPSTSVSLPVLSTKTLQSFQKILMKHAQECNSPATASSVLERLLQVNIGKKNTVIYSIPSIVQAMQNSGLIPKQSWQHMAAGLRERFKEHAPFDAVFMLCYATLPASLESLSPLLMEQIVYVAQQLYPTERATHKQSCWNMFLEQRRQAGHQLTLKQRDEVEQLLEDIKQLVDNKNAEEAQAKLGVLMDVLQ